MIHSDEVVGRQAPLVAAVRRLATGDDSADLDTELDDLLAVISREPTSSLKQS